MNYLLSIRKKTKAAKNGGAAMLLLVFSSFFATALMAQDNVLVKGSVSSQTGEPLQGVSVVVKGTTRGTTTLPDGSYQITAPKNSVLAFLYTGYITKEV